MGSVRCSTVYPDKFSGITPLWGTNTSDDDMCMLDDKDDFALSASATSNSMMPADDFCKVKLFIYSSYEMDRFMYQNCNEFTDIFVEKTRVTILCASRMMIGHVNLMIALRLEEATQTCFLRKIVGLPNHLATEKLSLHSQVKHQMKHWRMMMKKLLSQKFRHFWMKR